MTRSYQSGERTVQQVPLPPEVQEGITVLAEQDECLKNDVYDTACQWFLSTRGKRSFNYYIASPRRGKYTTIWVATKVLNKVRVAAKRDDVSINRVLYTALVLYLEHRGIL